MSQQITNISTLESAASLSESETAQIRLSLEGDLQAFSDLVRPYRPMFYKKALSILRNEADAEDVTQTALLKAFMKLSQFQLDSQFRTWVTSIVINEALMCLRASRRAKEESLNREEREEGSSTIDIADPRENPSHILERKELRAAILKAASDLPSVHRSVFILRDLRLLSISDTARMLGITETCVKARLRRARLQLQQVLAHFRDALPTITRGRELSRAANPVPWSWSSKLASEIDMESIR
jgi:RNA polymerase sigma-70 factor (ECF subfamily)